MLKWSILPLSFGKFFSLATSHFSISKGTVYLDFTRIQIFSKHVKSLLDCKSIILKTFVLVMFFLVPVSFAHTIKASQPIFVLLLSRLIWGERQSPRIYFSVIPIFIGIGMATISELNFNLIGTISAFASTVGYALQNLYTKKAMRDLQIHQHVLLQQLTFYGLFMMISLWCVTDAPKILSGPFKKRSIKNWL